MIDKNYYRYPVSTDWYKDLFLEFKSMLNDIEKNMPLFTISVPHKSIQNVEMFWVFCHLVHFKPSLMFESGVYKCRSTILLAETIKRYSPETRLLAVGKFYENEMDIINKTYKSVLVKVENGYDTAHNLIGSKEEIGVLIDGPKMPDISKKKYKIYNDLFTCQNLKFLFQHDVSPFGPTQNRFLFEKGHQKYLAKKGIKCYLIDEEFEETYKFENFDSGELISRNLGLLIKDNIRCL